MANKLPRSWIAFAAGKTGGHILPCLVLYRAALEKNQFLQALFFTSGAKLDAHILATPRQQGKIVQAVIPFDGYRKSSLGAIVFSFMQAMWSVLVTLGWLIWYRPTKLVTTGGFTAVPTCCAAFFLRIPFELWELNAIPGKAIKLLAPFAERIFCCFPEAVCLLPVSRTYLVDYPHRFSSCTLAIQEQKISWYEKYQLSPDKKTIMIVGGSQGAQFFNELTTLSPFFFLYQESVQLIHQVGQSTDRAFVEQLYISRGITAYVFSFDAAMEELYQLADLVISRAGAGTIFELLYFQKKTVLIPLVLSDEDHQRANAESIAQQYPHLFTVFLQANLLCDISSLTEHCQMVLFEGTRRVIAPLSSGEQSSPVR